MNRNRFIPPQKIHNMMWAHTHTAVLKTAVKIGVFTLIAKGHSTIRSIAQETRSSERGMEMLLNALVGFQILTKKEGRYGLTRESREFLVKGSPLYLGKMFSTPGGREELWSHLTEAVKTGKPVRRSKKRDEKKFWPQLVEAIFPGSYIKAKDLSRIWNDSKGIPSQAEYRILDVACGSGAWSIPFAERFKGVQVTALDYPLVLKVTRKFALKFGVDSQYDYLPGDLEVLNFGKEVYDLIILGNICHSLGAGKSKILFRKCFNASKSKGHLLIADSLPNKKRDGPLFPLLFALNMLLHSEEGNTFTLEEYKDWLLEAGYRNVETIPLPPSPSPIISARK